MIQIPYQLVSLLRARLRAVESTCGIIGSAGCQWRELTAETRAAVCEARVEGWWLGREAVTAQGFDATIRSLLVFGAICAGSALRCALT